MVRDIELPFTYDTKMSSCQLKFLLYLLIKQNGDMKPKWWLDNIRFEQPISNSLDISKDTLRDLFKSYYTYKGDSIWLRAVLYFVLKLDNLTNETDFTSIDISGKILFEGGEFYIVPSLKSVSPSVEVQPVSHLVNKKKKITILNEKTTAKLNISAELVHHFNSIKVKDKTFNDKLDLSKTHVTKLETDVKICMKESHIKQIMPAASVKLYDVVKYNKAYNKEDFLLTLNLMKTDILSKLNLLTFRKRLRNTSRNPIKSASEYQKDLMKFKSKPNKDVLRDQTKIKKNIESTQVVLENLENHIETSNTITNCMNEVIDIDMNKENEHIDNSSKDNGTTTPVNSICSPTSLLEKNNQTTANTNSLYIDLTIKNSPTKNKGTNNLYKFLNISPKFLLKPEKQIKQSPPKNIKRLNRFSTPLTNQKDIKSYFAPMPIKLFPEIVTKNLEELKKICKPCYVRLDLIKDLKPIRSITKVFTDEIETPIDTPSIPIITNDIIDLTFDENTNETFINENHNDTSTIYEKQCDNIKENYKDKTKVKIKSKPNINIKTKNGSIKKKKLLLKVKWPSKRITL